MKKLSLTLALFLVLTGCSKLDSTDSNSAESISLAETTTTDELETETATETPQETYKIELVSLDKVLVSTVFQNHCISGLPEWLFEREYLDFRPNNPDGSSYIAVRKVVYPPSATGHDDRKAAEKRREYKRQWYAKNRDRMNCNNS